MKRFLSFLLVFLLSISIFSLSAFAMPDSEVDFTVSPSSVAVALFPQYGGSAVPASQAIYYTNNQYGGSPTYSANASSQYFKSTFNITAVMGGLPAGRTYSGGFHFVAHFTPEIQQVIDGTWQSTHSYVQGVNIKILSDSPVRVRPDTCTLSTFSGYMLLDDYYVTANSSPYDGLLIPLEITVSGRCDNVPQSSFPVGRCRFNFNSFTMDSGTLFGHNGRYDPASQQIVDNQASIASSQASLSESQHDDLVNGFDDSAGNEANKSLEDGLASYESEEQKAHDDFNKAMDNYTNPDLSSYKSGFAFISSAAMSWWNALGMFKVILLVGFGLMIFNFISRYRGG